MDRRNSALLFGVLALVVAAAGAAHAQSSLGIGTNEATLPSTGMFHGVLNWINTQQQAFYRSLTGALKEMRQDAGKLWLLVGLSFAYGIFHAAGPGHGKAVISSYMLANEVALRRGVMLSFVSAFMQGAVAIVLMTLVYLFLRGTTISMTDATWTLETASYAMIAAFGAWLLWRKLGAGLVRRIGRLFGGPQLAMAHAGAAHDHHDHAHHHHHHHHDGHSHARAAPVATHDHHGHHHHAHDDHAHHGHDHGHHHHADGAVCETCGHSHAPDPALLSGDRFDWHTAWTAVVAVGLRPCSGALIVLTFAFLNGLWLGGVLSVVAMSIGTAITVAALATIAVTAKNLAVRFAGPGGRGDAVHHAIEIGGAALVMIMGLMLFAASIAA
jgi:ABC-type nickel/cobalt efflux system permease component RcnA